MPDSELAPWETQPSANPDSAAGELTMAEKAAPKVPPPPMDIALRTMESDVRSIMETGGSHPKPISISLDSKESVPAPDATVNSSDKSNRLTALIVFVTILILAGLGVFFWLNRGGI